MNFSFKKQTKNIDVRDFIFVLVLMFDKLLTKSLEHKTIDEICDGFR